MASVSTSRNARRLLGALLLSAGSALHAGNLAGPYDEVAAANAFATALTPSQAGADPFFVEPRVPRAAGTPCVVELQRQVQFREFAPELGFAWTPPTSCPGPYAKAVLVVEMSGPRPLTGAVGLRLALYRDDFGSQAEYPGVVFMGSAQEHALVPIWRLERDVTELASVFEQQPMFLYGIAENSGPDSTTPSPIVARSVKLILYPATERTPAERPADLVLTPCQASGLCLDTLPVLPRNIERVFLDVYARIDETHARAWYTCVRGEDFELFPELSSVFAISDLPNPVPFVHNNGCNGFQGGSWRTIEVRIDNVRAGLAPIFPWLPSDLHQSIRSPLDYPAPSVQALNMVPYRVDLTPFAGLLSDGQPHTVSLRQLPNGGGLVVTAQVLVYLDPGSTQVTGAVTRNDLANATIEPVFEGGFARSGGTTAGQLRTRAENAFVIEGHIDTSRGRITTRVTERHLFTNTQTLSVVGQAWWLMPVGSTEAAAYVQRVRLSSTVDRIARRTLGGAVLSDDRDYITWPLILDYLHAGTQSHPVEEGATLVSRRFDISAHQARAIRASHTRPGMPVYSTRLVDVFDASHAWNATTNAHTNWDSSRRYLFTDTLGSCYSAGLTTANGVLQTRTRGVECPNGNGIRWFAHPDGSPDSLMWAED